MQTIGTDSKDIDKGLLALNVIWVAMLVSLVIYFVVAKLIGPNIQSSMPASSLKIFRIVLYSLSAVILLVTRYSKKLALSGKVKTEQLEVTMKHPLLARYASACVISFAMSEAIGIFGLILYFIGKNPMDLYILLLVSAAAIFLYRPNREELQGLLQESGERVSE